MSMRYKHILSPLRIGNVILKDRLCCPNSSIHYIQGPEKFPAAGFSADLANRARNGAAYITVGEWSNPIQHIDPAEGADGRHMPSLDITDIENQNYYTAMCDDVHFYGSKLLVYAAVEMPDGFSVPGGWDRDQAGNLRNYQPLPEDRMEAVIGRFVEKLRLYKDVGYDGLSVRGDYTLTPKEGARTDEYGGSVENRSRFLTRLLAAVKRDLGKDFLIEMVLHGEQPLGYSGDVAVGYSVAEALEFLKLNEDYVDIVQLREKNLALAHPLSYNSVKGVHGTIEYAKAVRAAGIDIAIAVNGGYQDPDEIEQYLKDGIIDLASAARAFFCDPDYYQKIKEGRGEDIVPCLRCNKCHGSANPPWHIVCSVNPVLGQEARLNRLILPVQAQKRVAVIGGGVSGLYAAALAARRGHQVTLFEKTGYLGGQLFHGDHFSFKWTVRDYRLWLIRQAEQAGVELRLNTAVTPEQLSGMNFDAVIAAVGSTPSVPASIGGTFDKEGKAACPTCHEVIGKEETLGKKVAIIGGSSTGVETAMYLCENGHDVTVYTRQERPAHDVSHMHSFELCDIVKSENGKGRMVSAWERYPNLKTVCRASVTDVSDCVVTWKDELGNTEEDAYDSIVICGGVKANMDLALSFAGCAGEFYAIGECAGSKDIQRCTRDAYTCAMRL